MKKSDLIHTLSQHHAHVTNKLTEASAAVMVFFIENHEKEIFLLITKRPDSIATYAGDYCFPGGVKESQDPDLLYTAEREIEEELNLNASDYTFIGQLDDTIDRYGNVVRPFASFISQAHFTKHHKLAPDEIESIYLLPLDEIKNFARDEELEKVIAKNPIYSYRHEEVFIWGLTARIIVQLREIIF